MSATFFNSTEIKGKELAAAKENVKHQRQVILSYFLKLRTPLTPWEVYFYCQKRGHRFLIGSCRRAMTNMTKKSKDLVKTATKKKGPQGAKEFAWELNSDLHPAPAQQIKMF